MKNIDKIKNESKDEKLKQQMNVLMKKTQSDTEKLLKAFDNKSD